MYNNSVDMSRVLFLFIITHPPLCAYNVYTDSCGTHHTHCGGGWSLTCLRQHASFDLLALYTHTLLCIYSIHIFYALAERKCKVLVANKFLIKVLIISLIHGKLMSIFYVMYLTYGKSQSWYLRWVQTVFFPLRIWPVYLEWDSVETQPPKTHPRTSM